MNLDNLEQMEQKATPSPWTEVGESGDWWIENESGQTICKTDGGVWSSQNDIDLTVAARNALPALLRVARAAYEVKATENEHGYDSRRFELAMEELEAALYDLRALEQS